MKRDIKIVILGSLLYDCVTYGDRLPRKGETIIGTRNGFFSGGKGANQAVQAARLGADVVFIGRVGDDDTGKTLIQTLCKDGIDTTHVAKDSKTPTGTCCIHVDNNGDNAIMIAPLANLKVSNRDIDGALDAIERCDVFLTQLETNTDATEYAIRQARRLGVPVILNPAPATKLNIGVLKYVDYITPNELETEFFTGVLPKANEPDTCIHAAQNLLNMGVKNVIITLGASGAFYSNGIESYRVMPYEIDAVDATAAGDAFNAALAISIAEGKSVKEAIVYANATGAVAAKSAGSQVSLAKRENVDKFISVSRIQPKRNID